MTPQNALILIAEENPILSRELKEYLEKINYQVSSVSNGLRAIEELKTEKFDVAILSTGLPGLNKLNKKYFNYATKVIMISDDDSADKAVDAMKNGAIDFIVKPIVGAKIHENISKTLNRQRISPPTKRSVDGNENTDAFRRIVRNSESMQKVAKLVKQVAESTVPILLRGETGVGKDLIARAIHERSRRNHQPFVAVNCGSFTEDLFASELFGHKKGAFTGAYADKPGRFALADSGTLFLDEVGEVPLKNQVDLLRALESHEYQPLGDPQLRRADVRIIAATNLELEKSVIEGNFRDDLYYRLNVVPIDIPPLRKRREDIPILIETFLYEACKAQNQSQKQVSRETMRIFIDHQWPGNVRELRNIVQRLVVTSPLDTIHPENLPVQFSSKQDNLGHLNIALGTSIAETEAELIRHTLERVTSNRRHAAEILGISIRSLHYKLKQYDIT
ncbi:MAG: transcriptional regulator [Gemmatimonadetes bacterium]|nr:transcriptional regulator [Gemmatimonadota bacterium]